ncbi:MAG: dTDP-4-amino-4,6-dideoxygalactose transaminase [Bacteroidetes bacterium GWE2_29_8]|nr:MAG: dTDP-4-amino-4,6-dideoxygalactose transaminase [Bacteroidetes bacterium GWE2_29_8]OFY22062.1 MAG: dTDP-4-amino-4,6-dideoxygalactose transaminase [Bacteroidetes bacterium GWF2_29_10]
MNISFNKPYLTGKEAHYIYDAVFSGKISGNGKYTNKCHEFFAQKYGFKKSLLTTSCTDALEMAAILIDIKEGDEVIIPSYTFVSSANAFVLRGAKIVFADSSALNPNLDIDKIEELITAKTKAIVIVHYGGVAVDMDKLMAIANKNNIFVIEDAAQAIDSYYKNKPLGSIGHLAAFSFHETKNIISGEGGLLVINDSQFEKRAEIIWEKGTNRRAFFRGEVDKYSWVDIGSSYLPSDIIAAFLFAQLENIELIQNKRKFIWNLYNDLLTPLEKNGFIKLPYIPDYATNNAHMFYIVCKTGEQKEKLIARLKDQGILAVFHYLSLHKSPYYEGKHDGRTLPFSDLYSDCLIRLPLYYELTEEEVRYIAKTITDFFQN